MQAMDGKKQLSRQKLEKISGYLQFKQVSPVLTRRIIDFFEYQMTSTKSVMEPRWGRDSGAWVDSV